MSNNFRVGQKVVCINVDPSSRPCSGPQVGAWLKLGAIYEIRWIGEFPYIPDRVNGSSVRLVGIDRGSYTDSPPEWNDYPIAARRFRPIVESGTETGMAVLRKLLKGAPVPETVE